MADNDPIIIGQPNTASNPGNETSLSRNEVTDRTVFVARNLNAGDGIIGDSSSGIGVLGRTTNTWQSAIKGENAPPPWPVGPATIGSGVGVQGTSNITFGGTGVEGSSAGALANAGVRGFGRGLWGVGAWGEWRKATEIPEEFEFGIGVLGRNATGLGPYRIAGYFDGHLQVVLGNKSFKIDHPLDPENKYLLHTCVESSEMKNVYDGVARLDEDGAAWVELPEWFEALNGDFRYQLTAVGGSAPRLHVAEEISESRFKIAGGEEGMKACWQVTGSRKDPWAAANPFEVEQEKPEEDRGRYLEPGLYDAPEEQRVMIGAIAEALREASTSATREESEDLLRRRLEELSSRPLEELHRRMERQEEPPPEST